MWRHRIHTSLRLFNVSFSLSAFPKLSCHLGHVYERENLPKLPIFSFQSETGTGMKSKTPNFDVQIFQSGNLCSIDKKLNRSMRRDIFQLLVSENNCHMVQEAKVFYAKFSDFCFWPILHLMGGKRLKLPAYIPASHFQSHK